MYGGRFKTFRIGCSSLSIYFICVILLHCCPSLIYLLMARQYKSLPSGSVVGDRRPLGTDWGPHGCPLIALVPWTERRLPRHRPCTRTPPPSTLHYTRLRITCGTSAVFSFSLLPLGGYSNMDPSPTEYMRIYQTQLKIFGQFYLGWIRGNQLHIPVELKIDNNKLENGSQENFVTDIYLFSKNLLLAGISRHPVIIICG